jgi:hypothetical protein
MNTAARSLWTAVCVLISLLYLSGDITKSLFACVFVYVTASLDVASYRIAQLGVILSLVAFAVAFGFPPPARWLDTLLQVTHWNVLGDWAWNRLQCRSGATSLR